MSISLYVYCWVWRCKNFENLNIWWKLWAIKYQFVFLWITVYIIIYIIIEGLCETTMKLRKSLVKPVTWQKTCNYNKLFGSSTGVIIQDAFNVILWTSADICVVHEDLWWKNRTTHYKCRFSAVSLALWVIFSGRTTEQHIITGFGESAVDYNT